MKKLPVGRQEFANLIEDNCIYVDKTELIFKLIQQKYYFLSRPRRFGKSLLVNTLKEIFLGNQHLFEGLWIYDKINWEPHPVIKISFSNISYQKLGLDKAISNELVRIADQHSLSFTFDDVPSMFRELITKMAENGQVVILIDEYDKPIIDYLTDLEQAEKNRDILKSFYSIIKDADRYIRFFFVTGVSKFSKVSMFSDLNNLDDITLDKNFSTIAGWTQQELEFYFPDHIKNIEKQYSDIHPKPKELIKEWYDGYSWDGTNFVYNPVSLLNLFKKEVFGNYWFSTGTPTFLLKLIRKENYTVFDIENRRIDGDLLDKYEIKNINVLALLFQTGYLSIKKLNRINNSMVLDYPNKEVAKSLSSHILSEFTTGKVEKTDLLINTIEDALSGNQIDKVIFAINSLFKSIPYTLIENKENYFHSIFYMVVRMLGFRMSAEILTIDGRIDAILSTDTHHYVIEFKINQDAQTALDQIINKEYHKSILDRSKKIILLGINFDSEKRSIDDFIEKEI